MSPGSFILCATGRRALLGVLCGVGYALLLCLVPALQAAAPAMGVAEAELKEARNWAAARFGEAPTADLPISFRYGGKASTEVLPAWKKRHSSRQIDERRTEHTIAWTDPATGLETRLVIVQYRDFPIVEWTQYFKNTGSNDTPLLEQIKSLDATFGSEGRGEPVLHHFKGSPAVPDDYRPFQSPVAANSPLTIGAAGGRPSNSDLPFFNLAWSDGGVIVAVGWPGQWSSTWSRETGTAVRVRSGQETTHFVLHPGEEVRTPLMVLQFWKGDRATSHNVWRRWMLEHNLPRTNGKLPPTQLLGCSSHQFREMIDANEDNQKLFIDRYLAEGLKLDYWWMDAGWYKNNGTWVNTGTWEVDPKRFPKGLRAITDHGRSKGVKSIVWFEPERVTPGTWLYDNHPEWLLKTPINLDNPMAGLSSRHSSELGVDPSVTHNPTSRTRSAPTIQWEPGRLAFHPGPKGEYSVVRWTAPAEGEFALTTRFLALDPSATTDVHVLAGERALFNDFIGLEGRGKTAAFDQNVRLRKGESLDFVVGWGNGTHVHDSTGLEITLKGADNKLIDAAKEFHLEQNPNGAWSYGHLKPASAPQAATFQPYDRGDVGGDNGWRLLNLGDPVAWKWLTDHVDRTITEQGIDLYRQDFNIDPLPFWNAADTENRRGISEIRYVEGYLAYWDALRERHPNMVIDTCASGGRRNDLETVRRSVPLLRSDYLFEPTGQQCHTYGISYWYPYHGTGTLAGPSAITPGLAGVRVDPYEFRSQMAPSMTACWDVRRPDLDYPSMRKLTTQLRRIQPFYMGDYYPLTEYSTEHNVWMAWQFDRPEEHEGLIQVFRRPKNDEVSKQLRLRGLDPTAKYEVTNIDTEKAEEYTGEFLLTNGLPVQLNAQPAAAVFIYRRK